ncbi:MAG TPA: FtsW/RodA/SpoVE family cell cycle protein [Trebonia sp.]|jgi:cell division protein FtsW (lipid II flippase)|nr:FtsW/RodA/SpoVE family cell cycle protein [Trebonia sp.]
MSITMPSPALNEPVEVPESRRNSELFMLLFAYGVVAFAFLNVGLSLKGQQFSSFVTYMAAFIVITIGAHLAIRRWASYADPLFLPLATMINGIGIVFIYRLTQAGKFGNPGYGTKGLFVPMSTSTTMTQIIYSLIGIGCFVAVLKFVTEPRVLQRYSYILGLTGIILIALPAFLPTSISGVANTGAKIQISIGGFSLQPGEFGRLALAMFFAGYLVAKRDVLTLAGRRVLGIDLPRTRDLGPIVAVWAISLLLLVFESDVGMSAVFMGLFVAMIYVATSRTSWLLIGLVMFVVGAAFAAELFSHVGTRFTCWLHPFDGSNWNNACYQPVQGLYGMANGGLLGKGLGGGMPYLTPLVQSDFIFTGLGEELGLAGVMALVLMYALIVQRGLRTALMVKDPYSKLLAGGLSFMFALQVFVIVGGVTRLIPLTGITTPFISQGGSSLIANWALIGILVRLSDSARRPAPRPIQDEGLTQVVSLK